MRINISKILVFFIFFLGAISMSSYFHDQSQAGRIAIQGLIISTVALILIRSGSDAVKIAAITLPVFLAFSLISSSQYPIHLYLLVVFCVSVVNRPDRLSSSVWMPAAWGGSFFGLVLVIIAGSTGLITTKEFFVMTTQTSKQSLGFYNPNIAAMLSMSTVIISSIVKHRMKWAISVSIFAYVMHETSARTAAILLAVYYVYRIFLSKTTDESKRLVAMIIISAACFFVLLISASSIYPGIENSVAFEKIDNILSKRLTVALPSLKNTNTFFPTTLVENLDFAWINIIVVFGSISTLVALTFLCITPYKIEKTYTDSYLMCSMICFASLFAENIAYIYMPIGVIFAFPISITIYHLYFDIKNRLVKQAIKKTTAL